MRLSEAMLTQSWAQPLVESARREQREHALAQAEAAFEDAARRRRETARRRKDAGMSPRDYWADTIDVESARWVSTQTTKEWLAECERIDAMTHEEQLAYDDEQMFYPAEDAIDAIEPAEDPSDIDEQWLLLAAHPGKARVVGKRYRQGEQRDPRNLFGPIELRRLRDFYRSRGRLPAVLVISITDDNGNTTRYRMPPGMCADLAYRFDLEQEPEFF